MVGALIGLSIVRRLPRRTMLLVGQAGILASLLGLSAVFALAVQPALAAGRVPPVGASFAVLAFMLVFLLFQQAALSPVTWVMLSEVFPLQLRGLGMGVAVFLHWCVNAAISFAFPVLVAAVGGATTFVAFAVVNVGAIVFARRMILETSGRSLEELEADFRLRYA